MTSPISKNSPVNQQSIINSSEDLKNTNKEKKHTENKIKNSLGNYSVDISPDAKQRAENYKKAFQIAKQTPSIREEKIEAIKSQIDAGTYVINPDKIADGIAKEAILDYLANDAVT